MVVKTNMVDSLHICSFPWIKPTMGTYYFFDRDVPFNERGWLPRRRLAAIAFDAIQTRLTIARTFGLIDLID
jgi:hypothetical protein